jgi:hypothetical protein
MLARSATAPARKNLFGATWSGTLTASAPPTVAAIEPGANPSGGYRPISSVTPIAGIGDETVANFTVPAFQWGGETYTRIGVVSNGYLVVGGGDATDVNCCKPAIPNAARPNNVIAPYWTDLNPAAGGAIRAARVTRGSDSWLVVDFDKVVAYGSQTANTFQVWIQFGATEGVWMSYGDLGGAVDELVVGAENRDGRSGVTQPSVASGDEFRVRTTPPIAGGSVTYSVTYRALWPGEATVATSLRSDLLRAIPVDTDTITVTR